jgi:hypothetical protein
MLSTLCPQGEGTHSAQYADSRPEHSPWSEQATCVTGSSRRPSLLRRATQRHMRPPALANASTARSPDGPQGRLPMLGVRRGRGPPTHVCGESSSQWPRQCSHVLETGVPRRPRPTVSREARERSLGTGDGQAPRSCRLPTLDGLMERTSLLEFDQRAPSSRLIALASCCLPGVALNPTPRGLASCPLRVGVRIAAARGITTRSEGRQSVGRYLGPKDQCIASVGVPSVDDPSSAREPFRVDVSQRGRSG